MDVKACSHPDQTTGVPFLTCRGKQFYSVEPEKPRSVVVGRAPFCTRTCFKNSPHTVLVKYNKLSLPAARCVSARTSLFSSHAGHGKCPEGITGCKSEAHLLSVVGRVKHRGASTKDVHYDHEEVDDQDRSAPAEEGSSNKIRTYPAELSNGRKPSSLLVPEVHEKHGTSAQQEQARHEDA